MAADGKISTLTRLFEKFQLCFTRYHAKMGEIPEFDALHCLPANYHLSSLEDGLRLDPLSFMQLVSATDDELESRTDFHLNIFTRATDAENLCEHLGKGLLRHSKRWEAIKEYFDQYKYRQCCLNLTSGRTNANLMQMVKEDPEGISIDEELMVDRSKSRTAEEILTYVNATLCVELPILAHPSVPGFQDGHELEGQIPFLTPEVALDLGMQEDIVDIPEEHLIYLLKTAFCVSDEEHAAYLNLVKTQACTEKRILADDLGTQLFLLEHDLNRFYNPETFMTRKCYDVWKAAERRKLGCFLQKCWYRNDLPKYQSECCKRLETAHSQYRILCQNLFSYNSSSSQQQVTPLTSGAVRLLREFGFRYGVSWLYRNLVYLQLLTENFNMLCMHVQHINNTLGQIWASLPPERTQLLIVKDEYSLLLKSLTSIQEIMAELFRKILTTSQLHSVHKEVASAVRLLSKVVDLRTYLCKEEDASFEAQLFRVIQNMFVIAFKDCRSRVMPQGELVTPNMIHALIINIRDEVKQYDYSAEAFKWYFDITAMARKVFFGYLMDEISNAFNDTAKQADVSTKTLAFLALAYRIQQLEEEWLLYISVDQQTWKSIFIKMSLEWVERIRTNLEELLAESLMEEKFALKQLRVLVTRDGDDAKVPVYVPNHLNLAAPGSLVKCAELMAPQKFQVNYVMLTLIISKSLVLKKNEFGQLMKQSFQSYTSENDDWLDDAASNEDLSFDNVLLLADLAGVSRADHQQQAVSLLTSSCEESLQEDTLAKDIQQFKELCLKNAQSQRQRSDFNLAVRSDVSWMQEEMQEERLAGEDEDSLKEAEEIESVIVLPLSSSSVDLIIMLNHLLRLAATLFTIFCKYKDCVCKDYLAREAASLDLFDAILKAGLDLILIHAKKMLYIDACSFLRSPKHEEFLLPGVKEILEEKATDMWPCCHEKHSRCVDDVRQEVILSSLCKKLTTFQQPSTRELKLQQLLKFSETAAADCNFLKMCIRVNNVSVLVKYASVFCESLVKLLNTTAGPHLTGYSESLGPNASRCQQTVIYILNCSMSCQNLISSLWQSQCKILAHKVYKFVHAALTQLGKHSDTWLLETDPFQFIKHFIATCNDNFRQWLYSDSYDVIMEQTWFLILKDCDCNIRQLFSSKNVQTQTRLHLMGLRSLKDVLNTLTSTKVKETMLKHADTIAFKLNLFLLPTVKVGRLLWSICVQYRDRCSVFEVSEKVRLLQQMRNDLQGNTKSFTGQAFVDWVDQHKEAVRNFYCLYQFEKIGGDDEAYCIANEYAGILMDGGNLFEIHDDRTDCMWSRNQLPSPSPVFPEVTMQHLTVGADSLPASGDTGKQQNVCVFEIAGGSELVLAGSRDAVHKIAKTALYYIHPLKPGALLIDWPADFASSEPKFRQEQSFEFFDMVAIYVEKKLEVEYLWEILKSRDRKAAGMFVDSLHKTFSLPL